MHVSTGDLLRRHASVVDGSLAPDSLVLSLLKRELAPEKRIILDGFPRRLNQAQELDALMPDFLEAVLLIDVPESVLIERIQGKVEVKWESNFFKTVGYTCQVVELIVIPILLQSELV